MWPAELFPSNALNPQLEPPDIDFFSIPPSVKEISGPLPGSLDILLVFIIGAYQEAKGEGERGLEWAAVREGSNETISRREHQIL